MNSYRVAHTHPREKSYCTMEPCLRYLSCTSRDLTMNTTEQSPEPNQEPRSRLETEILEIIERADREPTPIDKARGSLTRARFGAPRAMQHHSRRWRKRLGGVGLLIVAAVLAVLSFVLDDRSALLGRILVFAAILAFVVFFGRAFLAGRAGQDQPKRWRGRDFNDDYTPRDSWKERFRK